MLKISESEAGPVVLQLEGRVIGPWVVELKRACERALRRGEQPKLDLRNMAFVDRQGASLLIELRFRGIELVAMRPFVEEQLKTALPG